MENEYFESLNIDEKRSFMSFSAYVGYLAGYRMFQLKQFLVFRDYDTDELCKEESRTYNRLVSDYRKFQHFSERFFGFKVFWSRELESFLNKTDDFFFDSCNVATWNANEHFESILRFYGIKGFVKTFFSSPFDYCVSRLDWYCKLQHIDVNECECCFDSRSINAFFDLTKAIFILAFYWGETAYMIEDIKGVYMDNVSKPFTFNNLRSWDSDLAHEYEKAVLHCQKMTRIVCMFLIYLDFSFGTHLSLSSIKREVDSSCFENSLLKVYRAMCTYCNKEIESKFTTRELKEFKHYLSSVYDYCICPNLDNEFD